MTNNRQVRLYQICKFHSSQGIGSLGNIDQTEKKYYIIKKILNRENKAEGITN